MSDTRTHGRIGLICNADHDVFSVVADRLEHRGFEVAFLEPGRRIDAETLDCLSLLANKKVDPASFRALREAEASGLATWNGYSTLVLGVRPIGLWTLERAGFHVPPTTFEKPDCTYVAKPLFDWHYAADPELNGEGAVYQEFVAAPPVDYKYYAVDDGERIRVRALTSTSKLYGEKRFLDRVDPDPTLAANVRRLMKRTGSQAIGVDLVRSKGNYYAVDVNPAMSFRNAGMEAALARSVAARHPATPGLSRRRQSPRETGDETTTAGPLDASPNYIGYGDIDSHGYDT